MTYTTSTAVLFLSLFSLYTHAAVIPFIDQADWLAALGDTSLYIEEFEGDAIRLEANKANHPMGSLLLSLDGGTGDPGPTGLTGDGLFEGEVDSNGDDALSIHFGLPQTTAFALMGLQNDSYSTPGSLAVDEIAISVGEEYWIMSDLVGQTVTDIPFLGFISDELIDSFSLFHAATISELSRSSEEFYLDGIAIAGAASVPEPSTLLLLSIGLLGMGMHQANHRKSESADV